MAKHNLDEEIDALFQLPLAEFTSARNVLAARLKKEGSPNDAERVKLLSKPSIAAWTVNQLYWNHSDAFDELIATGKRFRPANSSRAGGSAAQMRDSLGARREALSHLSDLATELLRDAGHNPTPETMRRITGNLEAISAHALLPGGPTPGRLTQDVDPPSFESLASLMARGGAIGPTAEPARITPSRKSGTVTTPARKGTAAEVRRIEEFRKAKIAAAKASLQDAKKSLTDARARAQSLEATQKKTTAGLKEAEKLRREAEQRLQRATSNYEEWLERSETVDTELHEATNAVEDAKRAVEEATTALESLLK